MDLVRQFLRRPRQLWLRRVNFQIHLWAGIFLALYVTVIGVSGSILVFGAEIDHFGRSKEWSGFRLTGRTSALNAVVDGIRDRYPHTHIVSLRGPTPDEAVFIVTLQRDGRTVVACDALSGQAIREVAPHASRIGWIYDLHENLLARRKGRIANGIGAALLLILAGTGLVNWWPGVRHWRRAVTVDWRRRWKRINFDLHSAVGFWGFLFVAVWATTGIYFAWPGEAAALINRASPLKTSRPPAVVVQPDPDPVKLNFDSMLAEARLRDPGRQFEQLIFPSSRRSPLEFVMSDAPGGNRDREDTLYFDPYTGRYMRTWRYGENGSLGDWIVWLQIPLHFGTHWGFAVKLLYAAFGLGLPVLSVTGLFMYWNRVLGKQWHRWRSA